MPEEPYQSPPGIYRGLCQAIGWTREGAEDIALAGLDSSLSRRRVLKSSIQGREQVLTDLEAYHPGLSALRRRRRMERYGDLVQRCSIEPRGVLLVRPEGMVVVSPMQIHCGGRSGLRITGIYSFAIHLPSGIQVYVHPGSDRVLFHGVEPAAEAHLRAGLLPRVVDILSHIEGRGSREDAAREVVALRCDLASRSLPSVCYRTWTKSAPIACGAGGEVDPLPVIHGIVLPLVGCLGT